MNYSFHPDAEKELEDIENYYDSIREELGDRFRAETEMAISRSRGGSTTMRWQDVTRLG